MRSPVSCHARVRSIKGNELFERELERDDRIDIDFDKEWSFEIKLVVRRPYALMVEAILKDGEPVVDADGKRWSTKVYTGKNKGRLYGIPVPWRVIPLLDRIITRIYVRRHSKSK